MVVRNVGLNPTRTAVIDVLRRMGAGIEVEPDDPAAAEPSGTVRVDGARLGDCEVGPAEVPNLIDELPVLAVAGALGSGRFTVRGARELRVKESDRITTMAANLRAFGADISEFDDGFEVRGGRPLHGAEVGSFGDHRVAMACAVAGLFATVETVVRNTGCIATSYPGFADHLATIAGAGMVEALELPFGS